jgi:CHAD domain-containing protein
MPYRFKRTDETVQHGLRRIAIEQLDKAVDEIDDDDLTRAVRVHQVRKRCKKLRALIRLVRPAFADYSAENATLRDAARQLAFARDAGVMIATYDTLMDAYGDEVARADFAAIRRQFTLKQKREADARRIDDSLARVRVVLDAARGRARHWQIADDGFAAIAGGLAKTYGRARKAMTRAANDGSAEAFHEWRKRMKHHGYHTRLLAPMWRGPMKARGKSADRLGDVLGAHHDLAVFEATLAADPQAVAAHDTVDAIVALARRRQTALATEALPHGVRLMAERKRDLCRRWQTYWEVWQGTHGPAEAAQAA